MKTRLRFMSTALGMIALFSALGPPLSAQSFTTKTFSVGGKVPTCAVADINCDGRPDLISANLTTNTLTVLTNNGAGAFGLFATLTVGNHPDWVIAADVNGDGSPDLITANANDNTLTVLTNDGLGGFSKSATLNLGTSPNAVLAVDINGYGQLDLVGVNPNGTLIVFTNNGSGGFGSNATLKVGSGPNMAVAADVNGDGKLDLISANANTNTLTVLTNNGQGGFGFQATLTVGAGPASVAAADVNGDGKIDLISANANTNTLTVLTNNGLGVFGSNATLVVGSGPFSVTVADVNGDGFPDLACANATSFPNGTGNTVKVLTNNGALEFALNATITVGTGPFFIAAADLTGDGKPDLVTPGYNGKTLTVSFNNLIFPAPASTPMPAITSQGNSVLVSWPSSAGGWSLQQNSDLTTTNWWFSGYGGYSIGDAGTNKCLTFPALNGNLFFRLLHP